MGCVSSKEDINDLHPNIFQVLNVDEMGHIISPGQLEVTETELVLYQRGKTPTRWPLRCLRKYGFDSEIFTFECGRRCPTGAGIYAFRCRKAEQLFNMLQQNIQLRNLSEDNPISVNLVNPGMATNEHPIPLSSTGPPVHRRVPSQTESHLNPSQAPTNVCSHPTLSRPGSLTSNGPTSPPALSPPPNNIAEPLFEDNNNKRGSLIAEHSYTNASALFEVENNLPNYMNLNTTVYPTLLPQNENYINIPDANSHLYMNVSTSENPHVVSNVAKEMPNNIKNMPERPKSESDVEETRHCYANIDETVLENLWPICSTNIDPASVPQTPTSLYITVKEVNYVELDLIPSKTSNSSIPSAPESPKNKKSYVTIDFNKTNALSQSINQRIEKEEGSRKTRHNSTISELTTRHSNSLSD